MSDKNVRKAMNREEKIIDLKKRVEACQQIVDYVPIGSSAFSGGTEI